MDVIEAVKQHCSMPKLQITGGVQHNKRPRCASDRPSMKFGTRDGGGNQASDRADMDMLDVVSFFLTTKLTITFLTKSGSSAPSVANGPDTSL